MHLAVYEMFGINKDFWVIETFWLNEMNCHFIYRFASKSELTIRNILLINEKF